MENKTVVVLGNARSGTSMTAGLLSILGVNMNGVDNPSPQNPKGSFEDKDFITVTTKMHLDLKAGKTREEITSNWGTRFSECASKRSGIWGFKSALTHFHLDTIMPLLNNPYFVVVTRNILHNAQSFVVHQRDNYGTNVSIESALGNMADSTKVLIHSLDAVSCPRIHTTYEDIKKYPIREIDKLAKFLSMDLTPNQRQQTIQFIMPNYSTLEKNGQKK